jgi:hypothetical protein
VHDARAGIHAGNKPGRSKMKTITKDQFAALLDQAGVSADQRRQIHALFEKQYPDEHQGFLEHLGVPADGIREIREKSRKP